MKRLFAAAFLMLAVIGCQAGGDSAGAEGEAVAAEAPNLIMEFTDEKTAYQCSSCKMVFDGPGECSMKDGELIHMNVAYSCPTDDEVFETAGTCPTHEVDIVATLTSVEMGDEAEGEDHSGHDHEETS